MRALAFVTVYTCTHLLAWTVAAQEQSEAPVPKQPSSSSHVADLSELMITTQLRHFKLWYAGRVANWPLAKYEAVLVRRSLDEAATLYPIFQSAQQAKLIADESVTALDAIDTAVTAKDRTAFATSFKTLTDACNGCHRQTNIGFVLIRVPTSEHFNNQTFPLNNQEFAPQGK
jgi:hypothetical protein